MPYQFFMPRVVPERLWCLAIGMLMILSAFRKGSKNRPIAQNTALEVHVFEAGRIGENNLRARAAPPASAMPDRSKHRRGSFAADVRHNDPLPLPHSGTAARLRRPPRDLYLPPAPECGPKRCSVLTRTMSGRPRNEAAHAAQFLDRGPGQLRGIVSLYDRHLGKTQIGRLQYDCA